MNLHANTKRVLTMLREIKGCVFWLLVSVEIHRQFGRMESWSGTYSLLSQKSFCQERHVTAMRSAKKPALASTPGQYLQDQAHGGGHGPPPPRPSKFGDGSEREHNPAH
jgi:hypothetical protein